MELTDLIRALIPVLPVVIISLAASVIPRFISTKPPVFELKKEVIFRLHWIYKISVLVIDITCLLVAIFLIWGSIISGPRVLGAPMFWVIIAIFFILFMYIHKSFSDVYVRIDSQGITTRKFYGRMKNVPIQIFLSTSLNHTAISSSLKTFGAEKLLSAP